MFIEGKMISMTTNKLTHDELSALLGQQKPANPVASTGTLSRTEVEAITELLHVSLISSTNLLSSMLPNRVTVSAPNLTLKARKELFTTTEAPMFVVLGQFSGGIKGSHFLSISKQDTNELINAMNSTETKDDLEESFQVVHKTVEVLFDAITHSITTVLEQEVSHAITGIDVIENYKDFPIDTFTNDEMFLDIQFAYMLENQSEVTFSVYIPLPIAKSMAGLLIDTIGEQYVEEAKDMPFQSNNRSTEKEENILGQEPTIQSVQFSNFDEPAPSNGEPNNLNMLLDIPLQVTVELGRTKRMVKEILEVSQGSIIELDKLAGEPVDILINNKLIAVGEVVVIDENFGVRVTDILSTEERISKLR